MRHQAHRNELTKTDRGFIISPIEEERPVVEMHMNEHGFWNSTNNEAKFTYDHGFCSRRKENWCKELPLYNFYGLLKSSVEHLYDSWNPVIEKSIERKDGERECEFNYRKDTRELWVTYRAKEATRKTLAKKLREIWLEHIASLDPTVSNLHRVLFSTACGSGDSWENLYYVLENRDKYKYLFKDLLTYYPARISFLFDRMELWRSNWMMSFAKDFDVTTSLRKTLTNGHFGGIPHYLVSSLRNVELPEPAIERNRILAYCSIGLMYEHDQNRIGEATYHLLRTSDERIRDAIKMSAKNILSYPSIDFRRVGLVHHSIRSIFDYREKGDWDLLGLAKRSVNYHEEISRRTVEQAIEGAKKNKQLYEAKTALPPVSLPKNKGISFLDTGGDILVEGATMRHCVGGYAKDAVLGRSYIFHVEHDGEEATVEVKPSGFISQSFGPNNSINKATEYGKRALSKWAKKLEDKPATLRNESFCQGKPKLDISHQQERDVEMDILF